MATGVDEQGEEEENDDEEDAEADPWQFNNKNRFNVQTLYKDPDSTTAEKVMGTKN